MDVPSTPSDDPDHPEHERRALAEQRLRATRQQIWWATILYAVVITLTAAFLGATTRPLALPLYFASGIVVAMATARGLTGQFSSSFLQGLLTLVLLFFFSPLQLFIIFLLIGHIILPGFLWHWINMIHDANR